MRQQLQRLKNFIFEHKLIVFPGMAVLVVATYSLMVQAATFEAVPNNTIAAGSWVSSSGSHHTAIDEGAAAVTTDYVQAPSGTTVSTLNLDTTSPTNVASATSVRLYINSRINGSAGSPANTITGRVMINNTAVATVTITPSTAGYTWQSSSVASGTWSQADLDGMRIELDRGERGSGNPNSRRDDIRIASVYVDVTYTQSLQVAQTDYRWFAGVDSITPGSALAAQNAAAVAPENGQARLQMLMGPTNGSIDSSKTYKLQYAQRGLDGVCDISFSGEIYKTIMPLAYNSGTVSGTSATGGVDWASPQNALIDDTASATAFVAELQYSSSLNVEGFDFSIPTNATVKSVDAQVKDTGLAVSTELIKSGNPIDESEITIEDLNNGLIGVSATAYNDGVLGGQAQVQYIGLSVTYTAGEDEDGVIYHDMGSLTDDEVAVNGGLTSSNTIIAQQYKESNPFTLYTPSLSIGQAGLWDFSLDTTQLNPGSYCFRIVNESDTLLSSYTNIPELSVPPPSYTQSSYRWYANTDSTTPGSPLAAQNVASTTASQTPFRLRQIVRSDDSSLKSSQDFKLQYAEKVTSCSGASPYVYITSDPVSTGTRPWNSFTELYESEFDMYWSGNYGQLEGYYMSIPNIGDNTSTVITKDYDFNIPLSHTISSINFEVDLYAEAIGTGGELEVRLVKDGVPVGNYHRVESMDYGYTDMVLTIPYNEIGADFTPEDINSSEFGLAIRLLDLHTSDYPFITVHYANIGVTHYGATGDFSYYDNSSIGSSATITATGQDPTDDGRTIVPQQYLETDPFAVSSTLPGGQSALWDFSLVDNGAPDGTYCFRIVKEDGTPLDNYLQYPEITIGEGGGGDLGPTLDQRLRGGQSVIDGVKSPLGWD